MELAGIDEGFGAVVRTVRQEEGMSQDELADAVSKLGYPMSQATVGKIERGERKVTVGEGEALARALRTSLHALFLGQGYVTSEFLRRRLHELRQELVNSARVFESAQQLVSFQAIGAEFEDATGLRDAVLESVEDVIAEYRRDKTAENTGRQLRDALDTPEWTELLDETGNLDAARALASTQEREAPLPGLFGEYTAKFGRTVEMMPQAKAFEAIAGQRTKNSTQRPADGDD